MSDPNRVNVLVEPEWIIDRFPGAFSRAIAVTGDHVWVASSGGVFTALDRREIGALRVVGAYATVGSVQSLALDNRHLFADNGDAVQVVNVHDPGQPSHVGLVAAGYNYSGMAASEGLLGLAIFGRSDQLFPRLDLIDVRDPRQPVPLVSVNPPGFVVSNHGIDLEGNLLAYAVNDVRDQVTLHDVTRPASRVVMANVLLDCCPEGVALAGERLFTLTAGKGVARLLRNDAAEGAAPSGAITLATDTSEYPDALLAMGERHAFVIIGDGVGGRTPARGPLRLFAVDVAQPDRLSLAHASIIPCEPGCRPSDVVYADGHLFVAGGAGIGGVMVIDVAEVVMPRLIGTIATRTDATSLQIEDDTWLYVATGDGGLDVYRRPDDGWSAPMGDPAPVLPSLTPIPVTSTPSPTLAPPTATSEPPDAIFVPRTLSGSS